MEFLGCSFEDNNSTALIASQSNIIFQGSVRIHRNTGIIGGGLLLCGGSLMYLQANTSLILTNNKALHSGGGIYVEDDCMQPIYSTLLLSISFHKNRISGDNSCLNFKQHGFICRK